MFDFRAGTQWSRRVRQEPLPRAGEGCGTVSEVRSGEVVGSPRLVDDPGGAVGQTFWAWGPSVSPARSGPYRLQAHDGPVGGHVYGQVVDAMACHP